MLRQSQTERILAMELRHVCAELEHRLSAGQACSAETVFAERPDLTSDADAALEVIYTEFVTREHLGQRPTPDDFYARFPEWRYELEQLFQIHGTVGAGIPRGSPDTRLSDADRLTKVDRPTLLDGQQGPPADVRRIASYEVLCEIGRGGMGVVYKARQIGLNRLVALKMILSGVDAGPQERARFRAEAEAAARLQHPNIVQIHEVGEHDGRPFLCLEYVDGGNLEKRLSGNPWQAAEAARLIETLARAMHYAHQQGVVHRDLKPANILLQKDEGGRMKDESDPPPSSFILHPSSFDPKVTDFGLARRLPDGNTGADARTGPTRSGAIVGTPAFMAPEQAAGDGHPIGPAVDVHALGAILYELLTGRPPFQGVTVLETLENVRTRDPLPPSRLAPALPRDLETICLKCLEKEPGRRYASAAVLADDLGRFQRGEPILARPTPAWEKTWKWSRRRPAVAALLVSLVVLTMVALSSVTVLWRQTAAALVAMQQERDDKEAALASNLIALAERDWLANDLDAARRHLDECPPDRRSPKWRQLHRVCHAELTLLGSRPVSRRSDSTGNVAAVAWSPNGRHLAADYIGGAVKVWNLETGGECLALNLDTLKLNRLAFDADGNLVTMTWPPNLLGFSPKSSTPVVMKNWDVRIGRETASDSMALLMAPGQGALSGNGRRFVAVQSSKVSILDIRGQLLVPSMVRDLPLQIHKMTLSIDGRMLAWWAGESKSVVRVWDTTTWTVVGIPTTSISSLAFSPDGTRLAMGRYDSDTNIGFVSVWDLRNGREIVALRGHSSAVNCMAFSLDGRRLATSADQSVLIWDLETGKELFTFRGHRAPVSTLAFRFDGKRLASGGNDATVRIWDVSSGDERPD